ncbi:MFS transporter [Streptomyces sp. H27-S2]|uniref:MFS transporter n=1 Tax=Streptomyces antarcticus TaxID=2996458 RepID=UPI0022713357|nr:MFS transporter [Streptomyces sp. H27-S2]MCY0949109.1 MFS transporter [Streptomyces sp. H27-S2]
MVPAGWRGPGPSGRYGPPCRPPPPPPLRTQLRIRTLRTVVTGLSILFFGLGGLFYWMPSYYNRFFGLGEAEAAAVAGGSGLFGIVAGIVTGSWLGDRERGPRKGRRIAIGGAGLLFGTFALAGAVTLPVLVPQALCFTLANFGFAAALANLTAANADVVAAERRGLGFAVLQLLVTLGGSLGPWLIGLASDATDRCARPSWRCCCPCSSDPWSSCAAGAPTTRTRLRRPAARPEPEPPSRAEVSLSYLQETMFRLEKQNSRQ